MGTFARREHRQVSRGFPFLKFVILFGITSTAQAAPTPITVQGVVRRSDSGYVTSLDATGVKIEFYNSGVTDCNTPGVCGELTNQTLAIRNGAFSASITPNATVLGLMILNPQGWYLRITGILTDESSAASGTYDIPIGAVPFAKIAERLTTAAASGDSAIDAINLGSQRIDAARLDFTGGAPASFTSAPSLSLSGSQITNSSIPTAKLSGAVAPANGGTGLTSLTSNNLLVVNNGGTGFTSVAPGASGNVLTWNGTNWTTTAPSTSGITSVTLSAPTGFSVSGSPLTANGTLTLGLSSQAASTFLVSPSGSAGAPTFRTMVSGDVPALATSKITSGQFGLARGGTGADLSATGGTHYVLQQSSAGAAVTVGQLAASDISGLSSFATASSLGASDIPALDSAKITTGQLALARGGSGADLSATGGGTGHAVMQGSSGAALTIGQLAATDITAGVLTNTQISASAAIAGTKVAPDFGAQNVKTTGQIASVNTDNASFTCNSSVLNFDTGNFKTISGGAIAAGACTVRINNLQEGTAYTVVVRSTANTNAVTYSFSDQAGASPITTWKFVPSNGATTAGYDTVYSIIKIGTTAYVSWIKGF